MTLDVKTTLCVCVCARAPVHARACVHVRARVSLHYTPPDAFPAVTVIIIIMATAAAAPAVSMLAEPHR